MALKDVARHVSRDKALPRERIEQLCDPGTPLLELSALAGFDKSILGWHCDGDWSSRGCSVHDDCQ